MESGESERGDEERGAGVGRGRERERRREGGERMGETKEDVNVYLHAY